MPMKFRAHDTFFIRKGWLSKGMRCVAKKPDVFIAHDENPMDVLGIGANMVKALRYWLQTIGLTEEPNKGKRIQSFTDLGKLIYEHDTYIEELGTLYLLQYCLASQKEEATAWYFFFNEFSMSEFSREDFVAALQKYIKMEDTETDYAIRSLNDDFANQVTESGATLLTMHYVQHRSKREIARLMHVSHSCINRRLLKLLTQLRANKELFF